MNTLSKTLHFIQPDQPVPNFSVHLNNCTTDFNSYREKKWTVLFTHPEYFIPKDIHSFKSFLLMQNFLTKHNAKLLGLNPENARLREEKIGENHLGKNSKIIISDDRGIVRSIFVLQKMDYKLIKFALRTIQSEDKRNRHLILKSKKVRNLIFQKTDQQGFQPTNLFYQKNYHN